MPVNCPLALDTGDSVGSFYSTYTSCDAFFVRSPLRGVTKAKEDNAVQESAVQEKYTSTCVKSYKEVDRVMKMWM